MVCANSKSNPKTEELYFNFNTKTNPARVNIKSTLLTNGFKENTKKPWTEYIEELSRHKFCVCPPGYGVDTHRIYEAIYVGSIPIVLQNAVLYEHFKDLPILWVEDYDIIDEPLLTFVWNKWGERKTSLEKVRLSYWKTRLSEALDK